MRSFRPAAGLLLLFAASTALGCAGECRDAKSAGATATTSASPSSAEASKAVVAKYLDECWGRKDLDAIPKYVAPGLVNHAAIPEAQGAEGMKTIMRKLFVAFPDLTMKVVGTSVEGDDTVVVRSVFEGTHTARLDFKMPLEPTGKHVKVDHVHTFRVKDGRIVEMWMTMDRFDFLTQLGALPKPPTAP